MTLQHKEAMTFPALHWNSESHKIVGCLWFIAPFVLNGSEDYHCCYVL